MPGLLSFCLKIGSIAHEIDTDLPPENWLNAA